MKRFHFAAITLIACGISLWGLAVAIHHSNLKRDLELYEAFERGVRWGEREREHLVVHNGVTNKFDTIMEAMEGAQAGDSIYIAAGVHDIGTNTLWVPDNGTLEGSPLGTTLKGRWDESSTPAIPPPGRFGTNVTVSNLNIESSLHWKKDDKKP